MNAPLSLSLVCPVFNKLVLHFGGGDRLLARCLAFVTTLVSRLGCWLAFRRSGRADGLWATIILAVCVLASTGSAALSPAEATRKGREFLVSLLDTNLGLLPEYRGANTYWLFHDNYLAAKVLVRSHPEPARRIQAAMEREGIRESGKIELIFGEARKPLPFRQYQLTDVRRAGNKRIRTEAVTDQVFTGWQAYADLLLLACIAEGTQPAARQHWEAARRLWDGHGFLDAAAKHHQRYATYKLGLALIAAGRLSPPARPPEGILDKLLALQEDSGGWITDYDATGKKIGWANVETTCLAILGLEAVGQPRHAPPK